MPQKKHIPPHIEEIHFDFTKNMEEVYREMTGGEFSSAEQMIGDVQWQILVQDRMHRLRSGLFLKLPLIVCLCGSTRFIEKYQEMKLSQSLQGHIVLDVGCNTKGDDELFREMPPDELAQVKAELDELHLRKIDLADHVIFLNVGGYMGDSTKRELTYAFSQRKKVFSIEPISAEILAECQPQ